MTKIVSDGLLWHCSQSGDKRNTSFIIPILEYKRTCSVMNKLGEIHGQKLV